MEWKTMKAIILIGVSGCGKSTYLKETNDVRKRRKEVDIVQCSTDKYVDKFASDEGLSYAEAFDKIQELNLFKDYQRLFYIDIEEQIKNDVDFAIDRTNLTVGYRKKLINDIRDMADRHGKEVEVFGVSFDLPVNVIKERLKKRLTETGKDIPDFVIDNQIKAFEKPTPEEGFNSLLEWAAPEVDWKEREKEATIAELERDHREGNL